MISTVEAVAAACGSSKQRRSDLDPDNEILRPRLPASGERHSGLKPRNKGQEWPADTIMLITEHFTVARHTPD